MPDATAIRGAKQDRASRTPGTKRLAKYPHLHGSDFTWAIAFVIPYGIVVVVFGVFPIAYGFWMGSTPSLYDDLISDPNYVPALVSTLLFAGIGVNLTIFAALLLSGFFVQRRWWIRAFLVIFVFPWAFSAIPAFTSFHWMMIGPGGFLDSVSIATFGVEGPIWFNDRWLALGCNIVAYIWKWLPFWTLIFLAGRTAIPRDILEAADVDGASGPARFLYVTFPLLANMYLICTLLGTLWAVGDFTTVNLVSGGAPGGSTDVLATLGVRYAYDMARPELGVAAALSVLPVLIPLAIVLMRKARTGEMRL